MSAASLPPSPSARLVELGLQLPEVVAPLAAYAPAVRLENLIYVSGQLPIGPGSSLVTGVVGRDLDVAAAAQAAAQCALNALAAAAELAAGVDQLVAVVKVTGFVNCEATFTDHPEVINGASQLLAKVFGSPHARAAVGVTSLPRGACVEVDAIFAALPAAN